MRIGDVAWADTTSSTLRERAQPTKPARPVDLAGRRLRDLRVSITDRCNFRCTYCMPRDVFKAGFPFLPRSELLTFEEIERVVRAAAALGVQKVRLTGGEPLLRREVERLVAALSAVPDIEVALTTNGTLLATKARALKAAGLSRVTVSLDSLDDAVFKDMNDVGVSISRVLAGIAAAEDVGLTPVKINAVVKRGVNEGSVLPLARHFRGTRHVLRFIEFMDVGNTNGWRMDDVVTADELLTQIATEFPLEAIPSAYPGEVASRYRYRDGGGEVGVIASVTRPFCGSCTRARLSADGKLHTCLFTSTGHDLRSLLRSGCTSQELQESLAGIWRARDDRYSELRTAGMASTPRVEMSYIGG